MSDFSTAGERQGAGRYISAILQHWRLIVVLVVASVGTAYYYVSHAEKQYEATVDFVITPVSATDSTFQGLGLFSQSLDASSAVVTATRIFNSPEIRLPASEAMGPELASAAAITTSPLPQADVVAITATAPSPAQAARAANLFAETAARVRTESFHSGLRQQIERVGRQIDAIPTSQREGNFEYATLAQRVGVLKSYLANDDPTLRIVAPATPPVVPTWPRTKLTLAAAFFGSLLLGCGLAVLLEFSNPRVSKEEELRVRQRLPILARVPRLSARIARGYLLGTRELPGAVWREYRTLRAGLGNAGRNGTYPRSILVTSPNQGDGKTMTAVNLAITLAATGDTRVILVDADLNHPTVAEVFQVIGHGGGVTGVLAERLPLDLALVPAPERSHLTLLPAHLEHRSQMGLFDPRRVQSLVDQLTERADVVVIDSPPVTEVGETLDIAAAVDSVLVCVRLGHTKRESLNLLREMLARRGVSPHGFVVTTRRPAERKGYDYAPPRESDAKRPRRWAAMINS